MDNRKRAIYYFAMQSTNGAPGYVVATYNDGSTRYWNEGDRGYEAARARALKETRPAPLVDSNGKLTQTPSAITQEQFNELLDAYHIDRAQQRARRIFKRKGG